MSCQGSIRSLVFIETWAPMWKLPGSCQKKENVVLSWSTSGFADAKRPSGTLGLEPNQNSWER